MSKMLLLRTLLGAVAHYTHHVIFNILGRVALEKYKVAALNPYGLAEALVQIDDDYGFTGKLAAVAVVAKGLIDARDDLVRLESVGWA
jgi:hypothetical protein